MRAVIEETEGGSVTVQVDASDIIVELHAKDPCGGEALILLFHEEATQLRDALDRALTALAISENVIKE